MYIWRYIYQNIRSFFIQNAGVKEIKKRTLQSQEKLYLIHIDKISSCQSKTRFINKINKKQMIK